MSDPLAKLQTIEEAAAFDIAQFQVLEQFYEAWEALHAIPAGLKAKTQKEDAAAKLVELAHVLRRMRDDKPKILVPRFAH